MRKFVSLWLCACMALGPAMSGAVETGPKALGAPPGMIASPIKTAIPSHHLPSASPSAAPAVPDATPSAVPPAPASLEAGRLQEASAQGSVQDNPRSLETSWSEQSQRFDHAPSASNKPASGAIFIQPSPRLAAVKNKIRESYARLNRRDEDRNYARQAGHKIAANPVLGPIHETLKRQDLEIADWMIAKMAGLEILDQSQIDKIAKVLRQPNMRLGLQNTIGKVVFKNAEKNRWGSLGTYTKSMPSPADILRVVVPLVLVGSGIHLWDGPLWARMTISLVSSVSGLFLFLTGMKTIWQYTTIEIAAKFKRIGPADLFIHEFTHRLDWQFLRAIPAFRHRLLDLYGHARASGKKLGINEQEWLVNENEYLAYGVQAYFNKDPKNGRRQLKKVDPGLFKLIEDVFGPSAAQLEPPAPGNGA